MGSTPISFFLFLFSNWTFPTVLRYVWFCCRVSLKARINEVKQTNSSQSCPIKITSSSSRRRKPAQDDPPSLSSFRLSASSSPQHLLLVGQKKQQSWSSLRIRVGQHWVHRNLGWDQIWTKRYLQIPGSLRPSVAGPGPYCKLSPNDWSYDSRYREDNGLVRSEGKGKEGDGFARSNSGRTWPSSSYW